MTKEELQEAKMMAEELAWTMDLHKQISVGEMQAMQTLMGEDRYFEIIDFRTRNISPENAIELVKNIGK